MFLFTSSLQKARIRNYKTQMTQPESPPALRDGQIRAAMQIIFGWVFREDELSIPQCLFLTGIFNWCSERPRVQWEREKSQELSFSKARDVQFRLPQGNGLSRALKTWIRTTWTLTFLILVDFNGLLVQWFTAGPHSQPVQAYLKSIFSPCGIMTLFFSFNGLEGKRVNDIGAYSLQL